jgi:MoxR-like ATPase
MLAGLPLIELPSDLVAFPGCDLSLPLLPEMRPAIGIAVAETGQQLILIPPGAGVGVVARLVALSAEPDPAVTLRPISRIRRSTGLVIPEIEGINADEPQVIEVVKLAHDFLDGYRTRGWFDAGDSPPSLLDAVAAYGCLPTSLRVQVLEAASWEARVGALLPVLRQAVPLVHGQRGVKQDASVLEGLAPVEMAAQVASRMEAAGMRGVLLEQARRRLDLLVQRCRDRDSGAAAILAYASSIPWETSAEAPAFDIGEARRILDQGHIGTEHVKRRVIEDLAMREYARQHGKPDMPGTILCLVGEPGVGKTSFAKLIAKASGRRLARLALGGVSESHSLVGTPSHYKRSGPGAVIEAIRASGSLCSVLLLDEIDKISTSNNNENGDPAAVLLALLDPEQRDEWHDQYLDLPVRLGGLIVIATANSLTGVPAPLKDRMELIQLNGYSQAERFEIGRLALLPAVFEAAGVTTSEVSVDDEAVRIVASRHPEPGVRQMRRDLEALVRRAVVQLIERKTHVVIDARRAEEWLERPSLTRVPIGFRNLPIGSETLIR